MHVQGSSSSLFSVATCTNCSDVGDVIFLLQMSETRLCHKGKVHVFIVWIRCGEAIALYPVMGDMTWLNLSRVQP